MPHLFRHLAHGRKSIFKLKQPNTQDPRGPKNYNYTVKYGAKTTDALTDYSSVPLTTAHFSGLHMQNYMFCQTSECSVQMKSFCTNGSRRKYIHLSIYAASLFSIHILPEKQYNILHVINYAYVLP